ncbi:MAG TPA: polysaccharide biosynthesis/export family protein [Acidobacteriaceae bacterium]
MKSRLGLGLMLMLVAWAWAWGGHGGAAAQMLQTRHRYQIHPGDQLDVRFRLTPEYNQVATVQPDGFITLTIAGDVKVAALSVPEAEAAVAAGSSVRLKNPAVAITLTQFQKPYFVVAGHVGRPGRYDMQEDTTAMQALLLAGGPLDTGKVSQILIYRRINETGAEVRIVNLKKLRKTADLERDAELQSGDMLYVPENTLTRITDIMRIGNTLGLYVNPLSVVP